MARALGKALFWDMQVASDGVQAQHISGADLSYSTGAGPNHQLEPSDFPLTRLATPGARGALDPTRNPWRLERDDPLEESTKSH